MMCTIRAIVNWIIILFAPVWAGFYLWYKIGNDVLNSRTRSYVVLSGAEWIWE